MHQDDFLHQCIAAYLLLYEIGINRGKAFCSFLYGYVDVLFLGPVPVRFQGENVSDIRLLLK